MTTQMMKLILNESIEIDIKRTKKSHEICNICNKKNTVLNKKKMKVINNQAILLAYVETNVLIPEGSRAGVHFILTTLTSWIIMH